MDVGISAVTLWTPGRQIHPVIGLVAASSHGESGRLPAEVALLIVCAAVLIAVATPLIRRAGSRRTERLPAEDARLADAEDAQEAAAESQDDTVGPDQDSTGSDGNPHNPGSAERGSAAHLRPATLVPAAAVLVVACVAAALVLAGGGHSTARRGNPSAAGGLAPGQPAYPGGPAGTSPAPGKHPPKGAHAAASRGPGHGGADGASPAPGRTASHGGTGSGSLGSGSSGGSASGSSGTGSAGSGSSGSGSSGSGSSGSGSAPAPAASIVLPSGPVVLDQIDSANPPVFDGDIELSAVNGSVSYTISYSPANEITLISSTSGTISAGGSVFISIQVTQVDPGSVPSVSVNPGGGIQLELVGCGSEGVSC